MLSFLGRGSGLSAEHTNAFFTDEENLIFESQAMESIIGLMNDFVKDYRGNIDQLKH